MRSSSSRNPGWAPAEGILAAIVILALVLFTIPWGGVDLAKPGPGNTVPAGEEIPTAIAQAQQTPPASETTVVAVPTATTEVVAPSPTANATEPAVAMAMEGAIFPEYRVLSYYGFPGVPEMGVLGEYEMSELLDLLRQQAAEYEQIDPSRPVKLAFEVIASVAQQWEGDDGDHLAYIGREQLQAYVDFTADNDILLILDMQFGRKTVQEEFSAVREFLLYPHVHLALDPEFAVDEGEVPSQVIGQIDAADVAYAQTELARLAEENNLPPKMLIVHQFTEDSITNREAIMAVPGVQFVLEVDGFGTPDQKRQTYAILTSGTAYEHYGFKLWYNLQDDPLMTPGEVLSLDPSPDLIIYQ